MEQKRVHEIPRMVMPVRSELARRETLSEKLAAYLKAHEGEWIPMSTLASIGGIGGWRTRLSELSRGGMHIEWNGRNGAASAHRYLSYRPLARDGAMPTKQRGLF